MLLKLYAGLTQNAVYFLDRLLEKRLSMGKELPDRINEKRGMPSLPRPPLKSGGKLIWIHGASIGETRSSLSIIKRLLKENPDSHILVTSGTITSARILQKDLPKKAFHQFLPLDNPEWVKAFLDHWQPDGVIWIESEIWPNFLMAIKQRAIPAILVNARMSDTSFKKWKIFKNSAAQILQSFDHIIAQTEKDKQHFEYFTPENVSSSDNLKYFAAPLPVDKKLYDQLNHQTKDRKIWVYASTHDGEETLAANAHRKLKKSIPGLLTIIVPRHPERTSDILENLDHTLKIQKLSDSKKILKKTDILIGDTLGNMGAFYKLADIAMIGRSFSNDGGGGHNPLEPAHFNCAILHGPHMQFQQQLCDDMAQQNAVIALQNPDDLQDTLLSLFKNPAKLKAQQKSAKDFIKTKAENFDTLYRTITDTILPDA